MSFINRQQNQLKPAEAQYFNNWALRKGQTYFHKFRMMPEVVLNDYQTQLANDCIDTTRDTDLTRLNSIKLYIDFVLNIQPRYKKLLKLYQLRGVDIGMMLGYGSAVTWHKSYKRYTYIRFMVTMINKHEELLNRLNNPTL